MCDGYPGSLVTALSRRGEATITWIANFAAPNHPIWNDDLTSAQKKGRERGRDVILGTGCMEAIPEPGQITMAVTKMEMHEAQCQK